VLRIWVYLTICHHLFALIIPEIQELRSLLNKEQIRLISMSSSDSDCSLTEGECAVLDQILCSLAAYFIGTEDSTFTFRIFEEREILGFDPELTYSYLCPEEEALLPDHSNNNNNNNYHNANNKMSSGRDKSRAGSINKVPPRQKCKQPTKWRIPHNLILSSL
jgi:hypothetical protein